MDNYDPADLNGDGEFDGIDIAFLDDEVGAGKQKPTRGNSGCCVVLMAISSSVGIGWLIGYYVI